MLSTPQLAHHIKGRIVTPEDADYAGFLGDEGEARVRAAYPGATWERLAGSRRPTTRTTAPD